MEVKHPPNVVLEHHGLQMFFTVTEHLGQTQHSLLCHQPESQLTPDLLLLSFMVRRCGRGKATRKAARGWCSPWASRDVRGIPENSVLTEVNYLLPDLQHPELLSLNCWLKKALHYSCEKKKINRDMFFYPSSSSSSDSVIPLNSNNALNGHNKNCNFKEPSNTCSPFSVQALAKLVWFFNSSVICFQTVMVYNAKCYLLSFSFLSWIINRELTQGSNIKTKSTWPIQTLQRHC